MKTKALILDFDGLIIDTETAVLEAWQEAYLLEGLVLDPELVKADVGVSNGFNARTHLESLLGKALEWDRILETFRQRHADIIETRPLLPGVLDLLERGKSQGYVLGLASSSSLNWVGRWLDKHSLTPHFTTLVTGDRVTKRKPHPEPYLLALSELGADPARSYAFEDSFTGVTAAKAAGLNVVAVPNVLTLKQDFSSADRVLASLHEFAFPSL